MATVKRLDKNAYEVRWDEYGLDGKRHQRRQRFDRAAAANDFAKALDEGRPYEAATMTLEKWVNGWFADYAQKLEASTVVSYRRILDRWIAALGGVKIADLRPTHIDKFYAKLAAPDHPLTDKPLSSSSIQRHHAVMHRALAYAVRDGLIAGNPLDRVDRPRSSTQEISLPDLSEVQARLSELSGSSLYIPVVLALMTGMRQSEVLGLRWDCVDLARSTITVCRVRQRIGRARLSDIQVNAHTRLIPDMPGWIERDTTKNKHIRQIDIAPSLCALLKSTRTGQVERRLKLGPTLYHASDYVCVYDDGKPVGDSELSHAMREVCRFHDLRHINATQLLIAGYSPNVVADILGHTTATTTLQIYGHSVAESRKQAASTIASKFDISGGGK